MSITGTQVITYALNLLGELSPGQGFSTSDGDICLPILNSIIDNASIQEEMATAAVLATVALASTVEAYTLSTRLSKLVSASLVITATGQSEVYPLEVINAQQYNQIEDKNALSIKPTKIFYDSGFPTAQIHLVPIPNATTSSASILGWAAQSQFATLSTSVTLYPGYERYLVTELALQLASIYPRSSNVTSQLIAANKEAKNEIRALNAQLWGKTPTTEGGGVVGEAA